MVGQGVLSELDSAPDVLINNAGVSEGGGVPLWEVEKEVWDNVLGVNVHGTSTLRALQHALLPRARGLPSLAAVSAGGTMSLPLAGGPAPPRSLLTNPWCWPHPEPVLPARPPLLCVPRGPWLSEDLGRRGFVA